MFDPPTRPIVRLSPESRRKLTKLFMRLSRVPIDGVTGLPLTPGTGGVGGTSPGMATSTSTSGTSGSAVQNEGTGLAPRRWLNFIGTLINATDSEANDRVDVTVTDPIPAHEAASNPHPTYATDADLTAHGAAADPHPGYVQESLVDAKGDMLVGSAADAVAREPVSGNDGWVWTEDSTAPNGVRWAAAPGGGGGGHVIQNEGSSLTARTNLNFTGDSVDVTDDIANDQSDVAINHLPTAVHTVAQPVAVHKNGTLVGTRKNVNFIEGTNVTLTVADDAGDDEVDVTIAAAGGGGGGGASQTAYASRPAAGNTGDLHLPTDSFQLGYDDGTNWDHYGPIFQFTRPPLAAAGTWVNQGSSTLVDDAGGLLLTAPAGAGNNLRGSVLATIPAEPWAVTVCFYPVHLVVNFMSSGIFLRENATGKLTNWVFTISGSAILLAGKYNSPTSYSANYTTAVPPMCGPIWLRIRNDATNRHYEWSPDGRNWVTVFSVAKNDFATTAYDQAGIHVESVNASFGAKALYMSWQVS